MHVQIDIRLLWGDYGGSHVFPHGGVKETAIVCGVLVLLGLLASLGLGIILTYVYLSLHEAFLNAYINGAAEYYYYTPS